MTQSNLFGPASFPTWYDMAAEARACNNSALSPVSRLPPEVLATIFIHRAREHYDHQQGSSPSAPSWVNVSYVCRYWRSVALDCPTLWTYHFVVSPRWTKELLVRSREASLRIRARMSNEFAWWPSLVNEWGKHVERIQELILHVPDRNFGHKSLYKLSSYATRLQTLKISVWSDYCEPPGRGLVLLDGDSPALRTLKLSYCPVTFSSLKLAGLTTLVVRYVPRSFPPTMEKLLAMLSCMQALTHLELHRALASATGFSSSVVTDTLQKINLPCLSHFSIVAPLSTVTAFLSWVNMPWDTEVELECEYERTDSFVDGYSRLSSLVVQRLNMVEDQGAPSSMIRSLVAELKPHARTLTFSASDLDSNSFRLKIDVEFSIVTEADRFTSDICCSISLNNVQSVDVEDPPTSTAFWRKMLERLPNLRRIRLRQGHMPDLVSVLSCTTHDDEGEVLGGHPRMLVPALEELELDHITFLSEGALSSLLGALSTRDAPKGRLAMTGCCMLGSSSLPDMVRLWDRV